MPATPVIWLPAPDALSLGADEVHLWRIDLDERTAGAEDLLRLLSADEAARAARLVTTTARGRFVVSRAALRLVLGRYAGVEAGRLRFSYGPRGRPELDAGIAPPDLRFNLSHSASLALLAVARRCVGVDVERVDPAVAHEAVASRFFAPSEVADFRSVASEDRPAAFFNAWTRKEAYMKATGQGLALGLSRFRVSLIPGEPPALLETSWDPGEPARWSFRALDPAPGYQAALAVEGGAWTLRTWRWAPLP